MLTTRLFAISIISTLSLLSVACSQPEQSEKTAANTSYVSENQQFVEQLNQEVELADPDALLNELNQSDNPNK